MGIILVICVSLCSSVANPLFAQRGRNNAGVPAKNSPKFLAAFREVVAEAARGTVRLRCGDKAAALGAIVAADGLILTKASELKGEIVCRLHDGRSLPARIIDTNKTYDVALLRIEAKDLTPIAWRDSKSLHVGDWLATPGLGENPVAVGIVSVAARKVNPFELVQRTTSGGFLGIRIDTDKEGVTIVQIVAKSAAEKAGLEIGDRILSIEGEAITNSASLFKALGKTKPGQVATIRIVRDEEEMVFRPKLGKAPPTRSEFQNGLGSELSQKRRGFPVILQHDTVLRPSDCGGPIVDLDGKAIGLNIARAGRTETYAIPAEEVKTLLKELQADKPKADK